MTVWNIDLCVWWQKRARWATRKERPTTTSINNQKYICRQREQARFAQFARLCRILLPLLGWMGLHSRIAPFRRELLIYSLHSGPFRSSVFGFVGFSAAACSRQIGWHLGLSKLIYALFDLEFMGPIFAYQ